jgi:hypothetical protein
VSSRSRCNRAAWGLAAAGLTACSSGSAPTSPQGLVVGIQSEPSIAGALGTLHVVTTVGGAPSGDVVLAADSLPYEAHMTPPVGSPMAPVKVQVEGYQSAMWTPGSHDTPILVRTAETLFTPNRMSLLRIVLQGQCLVALPGGPPGGPACAAPQTCVGGTCQLDFVPPADLEAYAAHWADNPPDACKDANAPSPVVQVGIGQSDYLPVTSGQTVQMEQGPQGGHHVWIAVRQRNLQQSGSTTTITSVVPTTGLAGPRTSYVFTFEPDEGNFCKLYGLRYQLDVDGADYHAFLGQPLDVTVTIKDASGATASGVEHLNIDPQLLCPTGISGCT